MDAILRKKPSKLYAKQKSVDFAEFSGNGRRVAENISCRPRQLRLVAEDHSNRHMQIATGDFLARVAVREAGVRDVADLRG
jgi:hypothetical protein